MGRALIIGRCMLLWGAGTKVDMMGRSSRGEGLLSIGRRQVTGDFPSPFDVLQRVVEDAVDN